MVVQISVEQSCALWPLMSETGNLVTFSQFLRNNQLDIHKMDGFPVFQTMNEEARKSRVPTEESLRQMNWLSSRNEQSRAYLVMFDTTNPPRR